MKVIKNLVVILLLALLAGLAFIFWPKIRECCERWMAGHGCCGDTAELADTDALVEAEPVVDEP